jgi:hypothetical protein
MQAGEGFEKSGFAGAIGSDERDHFALPECEIGTAQHLSCATIDD